MGKSKARRPAPPNQPPGVPAPPEVVDHEPVRYSWKRLGLSLLIILLLTGLWWYGVRPQRLVRQARAILTTDPQTAAGLLEDAVASSLTNQRDAEVLWTRALVRSGQGEEALGCFSLIKAPELAEAGGLLDLANDAMQAQLTLLAVLALEAIPPTSPRRSDALSGLVHIKQLYGEHAAALKLAAEWAQLQPQNPAPWLARALTHEQQLSFTEATQDYREFLARENAPEPRSEGLRSLVRLLILLGEREEARQLQDELSRLQTTLTVVDHFHEAQLRRLEGNIDGAWREIEQVLEADASDLIARELRGTLAMDRHEYARAATDFEAILQEQSWNKAAHYKLAQTLAKLGRETESASHFAENRRLLKLSTRILDLRNKPDRTAAETAELIHAMEQTGLTAAAERLRQSTPE